MFIRLAIGEISPVWQNLISPLQYLEGLFSVRQNSEPTLAIFVSNWANFY